MKDCRTQPFKIRLSPKPIRVFRRTNSSLDDDCQSIGYLLSRGYFHQHRPSTLVKHYSCMFFVRYSFTTLDRQKWWNLTGFHVLLFHHFWPSEFVKKLPSFFFSPTAHKGWSFEQLVIISSELTNQISWWTITNLNVISNIGLQPPLKLNTSTTAHFRRATWL